MSTSGNDLVARLSELNDPPSIAFIEREQRWLKRARDKQVLPLTGWRMAIARSGRGWGKTEVGANWVVRQAGLYPGVVIHIIAPTHSDLTGTMINGVSGITAVCPPELISEVNVSAAIPVIKFVNGSTIRGFSAQSPERLRGPQCTFVWGDELAAWAANGAQKAKDTLSNLDMSTRIAYVTPSGDKIQPQRLYTTTPKPLEWLVDMVKRADINIVGSTYENRENLAEDFFKEIQIYEGTEIGRQELHGEILDPSEAAIIKRSWLRLWPAARPLPWFEYIIVSMDTAYTEKTFDKKEFKADPTACQVWGVFSYERRWNMMLLNHWKAYIGLPELILKAKQELKNIYGRRDVPALGNPLLGRTFTVAFQEKKPDLMLIEDKGSGISLRQMLEPEGIECYPYNPGKADKLARLHAVSHVAAGGPDPITGKFIPGKHGRVWLIESDAPAPNKKGHGGPGMPRTWAEPMLKELCVYSGPGTTEHDDDVDCFSMSARFFADNWMTAGSQGRHLHNSVTVTAEGLPGLPTGEFVEGEDRLPGQMYHEDEIEHWYG